MHRIEYRTKPEPTPTTFGELGAGEFFRWKNKKDGAFPGVRVVTVPRKTYVVLGERGESLACKGNGKDDRPVVRLDVTIVVEGDEQ